MLPRTLTQTLLSLSFLSIASIVYASDPIPHPEIDGRFIATHEGLSIEYGEEHLEYVEPLFAIHRKWAQRIESSSFQENEPFPEFDLISKDSLQEDKEKIHDRINAHLGLVQAGPLQRETYEAFLDMYKLEPKMEALIKNILVADEFTIWHKDQIKDLLREGHKIEGFTYDPETDMAEFAFSYHIRNPDSELQKKIRERRRMNHRYNFSFKNGVTSTHASVSTKEPDSETEDGSIKDEAEGLPDVISYPIIITEEDETLSPQQYLEKNYIGQGLLLMGHGQSQLLRMRYSLGYALLHETVETSLIENYIVSSDRRWICDGTANYLAYKIASERIGPENALNLYNLQKQLEQYAHRQTDIDLFNWAASEDQGDTIEDEELDKAHYAFATRVIADIATEFGDEALTEIWRRVGKTRRNKADMGTFAKAFRKVTGANLKRFAQESVNAPIAVPE